MEHQTGFNLNAAISRWQNELAGLSPDDRRELETHLRDDIERQMKAGLEAQRAFEISVQRIGKTGVLNREFKKSGLSAVAEMIMFVVCLAFLALITFIGGAAVVMCYSGWVDRVLAAGAMICSLMVACRWRYIVPYLPVIADVRKRLVVSVVGIALGLFVPALVSNYLVPSGPRDGFPLVILWSFVLLTILLCVSIGLAMNQKERERRGMTRRLL
jgi:hypothetical protein